MTSWRRGGRLFPALVSLAGVLVLAGCTGKAASTVPQALPSAAPTSAPTLAAPVVEPNVPATAVPATETRPGLPTATPQALATPSSPTAEPPTLEPSPTPTLAPKPPIGVVEQPPYAASDCSDKYPCNDDVSGWLERIRVPEGFSVEYYGRYDGQPTVITFGPDGLLYIAAMDGTISTMDEAGQVATVFEGLHIPTGLAFQPGTERLFVTSRLVEQNVGGESEILVIEDGEATQLIGGLPCCYTSYHAANGIAFGPDGYGYVAVGGRADHGEILDGPNAGEQDERDAVEASILRFNPEDGSELAPYARGFRNSLDIAFDADGRLYATDNMPDFGPPEEFNRVEPGREHGYPWYDCAGCFAPPPEVEIVPPVYEFPPHSSPAGVTAYLDWQFPGYYNSLFTVLWSAFPGAQKIVNFEPGGVNPTDWATGFAAPIDVTVGPDGSLYVADWATGIIFRISYTG